VSGIWYGEEKIRMLDVGCEPWYDDSLWQLKVTVINDKTKLELNICPKFDSIEIIFCASSIFAQTD
jgi:hypothetical protein